MDPIDQLEAIVNCGQQTWLNIEADPQSDGRLAVVVNIHGHFAVDAASDAPGDVAAAIGDLFDSMAANVEQAAGDALGCCTASHPIDGADAESDC